MKRYVKGILRRCKRVLLRFKAILNMRQFRKKMKKIDLTKYSRIIVFESVFGWSTIMRQRPQQIALNFSEDTLFLYHSDRDEYDDSICFKKIKENLILLNLNIYRHEILKYLETANCNKYLMIYSTSTIEKSVLETYKKHNYTTIYEYVDGIDETLSGKKTAKVLKRIFKGTVKNPKNIIICTADKLYNNILAENKDIKANLITNACDYEHFKHQDIVKPEDIDFKTNKPIIGYYGALASWFDYELIKQLAETDKYEIVLIGLKYDDTYDSNDLGKYKNIHYLGKKDYEDLPKYSNNFDVCMIPFIINEITLSTSPVKIFEYMASEKPIVTTDLPECRKYKSVLISKSREEFVNNIEKALELRTNKEYMEQLKKDALDNTWRSKCVEIEKILDERKG